MSNTDKHVLFERLCNDVNNCSKCPAMEDRKPVLSSLNGNIDSKFLFIAEAPGRLGADKYKIPLYGDATGKNFDHFLAFSGLSRKDIFITNCVLCNPRDNKGNNRKPSSVELESCKPHLLRTIELFNPKVVVTLGAVALKIVNSIFSTSYSLKANAANILKPSDGLKLYPLYHSSPLALIHRPKAYQEQDYSKLGEITDGSKA